MLLCEGEDIDPSLYADDNDDKDGLTPEQLDAVRRLYPSDVTVDHEKDSIELLLTRRCLERGIPFVAAHLPRVLPLGAINIRRAGVTRALE